MKYRGQSGGIKRAINQGQRVPEEGALAESQENLRVAKKIAYILKIVDAAPPLTDKQKREKLAAILRESVAP